jgi:hypothetical protein
MFIAGIQFFKVTTNLPKYRQNCKIRNNLDRDKLFTMAV